MVTGSVAVARGRARAVGRRSATRREPHTRHGATPENAATPRGTGSLCGVCVDCCVMRDGVRRCIGYTNGTLWPVPVRCGAVDNIST